MNLWNGGYQGVSRVGSSHLDDVCIQVIPQINVQVAGKQNLEYHMLSKILHNKKTRSLQEASLLATGQIRRNERREQEQGKLNDEGKGRQDPRILLLVHQIHIPHESH
jgi:hypothetical protein